LVRVWVQTKSNLADRHIDCLLQQDAERNILTQARRSNSGLEGISHWGASWCWAPTKFDLLES